MKNEKEWQKAKHIAILMFDEILQFINMASLLFQISNWKNFFPSLQLCFIF